MKPIDVFLTQIQAFLQPTQVITDPTECAHYAQDWSAVLTPNSPAIVFPETTAQVSQILSTANDLGIAVIPSGGRTGLSGGAVATQGEVVLSLIRMNFIRDLHLGALTVHAGAGVITQAVHDFCEPHGVTWPVDFASKGSSCVGGNIATNAGGVRVLRYGNTRNWILGLTAVTMDGNVHEFNGELEKNNTGYDLRQLMIGSEGTLAVVTEATLKLAPLPKSRAVFFFALDNFSSVIELFAFARARIASLSAFECMDRPCLQKTMEHFQLKAPVNLGNASGAPDALAAESDSAETGAKAFVLMEVENAVLDDCEVWLNDIFEAGLVLDGVMAQNEREAKELWHYREGIAEAVLAGHSVHQEDVSVPVARLAEFYSEIHSRYQKAFKMEEITSQTTNAPSTPIESPASNHAQVYFFGHIGDGNLHIFIQGPKTDADESTRKKFLSEAKVADLELFQVLKQYSGSISAEHGIGLLKRHAIHFSRSEPEIALMRGMKKVFDPKGLLNPGKVFE
jgi:FAD/FMN-containing dehydrogenase